MSTAFLEMPRIEQPLVEARTNPVVAPEVVALPGLNEADLAAMRRDDAMASGMIAIILGIAFSVLVCLAVGVGLWTSMVVE